jgi:thiosulfate dehydrogenase
MPEDKKFIDTISKFTFSVWILILCIIGSSSFQIGFYFGFLDFAKIKENITEKDHLVEENNTGVAALHEVWEPPDIRSVPLTPEGELIRYGRELVSHTARFLGPEGKVMAISNGMNCQNCHLEAGTKPFGNNYAAVASKYPVFRARSGSIESIEKRVNDCIERSLNGEKLDSGSREMKAFVAYLKWVGKDVDKDHQPEGLGIINLPFLDRPADPDKGGMVYQSYCARCHGNYGEGIRAENGLEWTYPPLFGEQSYNTGAGLYRLSRFAGYVKANMPYGINFESPFLTDEEAWDVAAYVNSMPRPKKDLSADWPDISKKPFDHPFGPYADTFSEQQHKFGPFDPIIDADKKHLTSSK